MLVLLWGGCFRVVFESLETVLQSAQTDPEYRGGVPTVAVHVIEGKLDIRPSSLLSRWSG